MRPFPSAKSPSASASSPLISVKSSAASKRRRGGGNIRRLALELGENPDTLLALAGKVSGDLLAIIRERPTEVAELLRTVKGMPTERVTDISRQIRDGEW